MGDTMDTPDPLQEDIAGASQYEREANDNEGSTPDDFGGEGDTLMTNGDNTGSVHKPTSGAKYEEPDIPTNYSLFSNPPNLGVMRERLFKLEDPVQLSPLDFDAYFKYVDNIWKKERSHTQQNGDGITTDTYTCRLKKDGTAKANAAKAVPDEQRKRKKVVRGDVDCGMTMKVIYTGGAIPTCTVVHGGKGLKHTHDLDYADEYKRCTGIMDVARREANKGFLASSTFEKMWSEPDKMRDAGGAQFKISDARNVQIPWREANRDTPYKVHTGFSGSRNTIGRRSRASAAAASPKAKLKQTSKSDATVPQLPLSMHIPLGTLQYPDHARLFLEDFMPANVGSGTRPHVTVTYASSLDGRISLKPGVQTAISGPETKAMTHYLRSRHDAILIGVRTAIADNPALNCRLAGVGGYGGPGQERQPRPIIIDPDGRLQVRPDMKILQVVSEGRAKAPWIVVKPSTRLRDDTVKTLKGYGGEYLSISSEPNGRDISWDNIFKALFAEGIKSVMVEGGGVVLSELLKPRHAHLLDSVIVTIAPTFMGKDGTAVSPDPTVDRHGRPIATRLQNVRWQPMGDEDVVMCGRLNQPEPPNNGILSGLEHFANAAGPPQTNGFAPVNGRGPAPGRA
jgi:2,5-diamino-6-(ribosylamino)-4(3H)-pyrimidinone 5'-phosphate reductase